MGFVSTILLISVLLVSDGGAVHITGRWNSDDFFRVLAKFGFQRTDPLKLQKTRGHIYGNVTSNSASHVKSLLVLSNRASFGPLFDSKNSIYGPSNETCRDMMKDIAKQAYHPKCNPDGKQDFFRWVPCPHGKVCPDEDKPQMVIPESQLTFRTQDEYSAGFWYISLVACRLDQSCNWTLVTEHTEIDYDLWLVNGAPEYTNNPLEHQFSFDEQDTVEIHAVALLLFNALLFLQFRAIRINGAENMESTPRRLHLLGVICLLKTVSILLTCIHVLVFAVNGTGVLLLQWTADIMWIVSQTCISLLLILIARGWSVLDFHVRSGRFVFGLWGVFLVLRIILFIWNYQAVDKLEEIDIYETIPGYGILVIRLVCMVWFILELRRTVRIIPDEETVSFLVHFGAGFLVWFVYEPALGLIASQISLLWRFKVILGVTYLADFLAAIVLMHLFWPNSTNRRFFINNSSGIRHTVLSTEDCLEDYERDLVIDEPYVPSDPRSYTAVPMTEFT